MSPNQMMHFATTPVQTNEQIEHPANEDSIGFDGRYDEGEIL